MTTPDVSELADRVADDQVDPTLPSDALGTPRGRASFVRRFTRNRVALGALVVLVLLVLVAILAPWITPKDPDAQDVINRLRGVGDHGLFGTDEYGRDVLSRLIAGARVSLLSAGEATLVAVVLGVPLGTLAGFHGKKVDAALSRVSDAVMSVPFLILALTVLSVVGYGLTNAMLVVGFVLAPTFFRITRGATQAVCSETFIEASRAIGCSARRTVMSHVLPNIMGPLLVQTAVTLGLCVAAEASLSFLGLGATPPTASWGSMLRTASTNINRAPHLVWAPGIMITLTVLCLTLVGDGFRDALGTRRAGRVKARV